MGSSGTTLIIGEYGSLTLSANGAYQYAVDNTNATVNALNEADHLDDQFTLTVEDGNGSSVHQSITIRIDGSNDGPISGGLIINAAPVHNTYEISDTWKRLSNIQTYSNSIPGRNQREFQNEGAFAALLANGSVQTWGHSYFGGDSSDVSSELSTDVAQVFSSSFAFAALRDDGSVITWGASYGGG